MANSAFLNRNKSIEIDMAQSGARFVLLLSFALCCALHSIIIRSSTATNAWLFAAGHTFLLINGYELEISSTEAYEFMMRSLAEGEFRFTQIFKWIEAHIVDAR